VAVCDPATGDGVERREGDILLPVPAALIEAAGEHVLGPFDGDETVTLLADLDAGCTGTMPSALQSEHISHIVAAYRAGDVDVRWHLDRDKVTASACWRNCRRTLTPWPLKCHV
jgi:hypothetical protein